MNALSKRSLPPGFAGALSRRRLPVRRAGSRHARRVLVACAGESEGQPEPAAGKALDGKTLDIYCGAGMTDPFQEIADAFQAETGCTVNVTFANAAQIQTQITTTGQGDFFIAGSADELKPVEAFVESSTDLVKHIPVLAVPAGIRGTSPAWPICPGPRACW